jgi:hypothetical protein
MNDPTEPTQRDVLARRFGFDAWPTGRSGARIAGIDLGGFELPGYRAHRVVSAPPPPGALAAHESVWVDAARPASDDAILLVDVYESASPEEAREVLLGLLGDIESTSVERVEGTGDVAFSPGEGAVLFVRGNVAVRVMTGGPAVESVREPAQRVDALIRRQSEGGQDSP